MQAKTGVLKKRQLNILNAKFLTTHSIYIAALCLLQNSCEKVAALSQPAKDP